MEFPLPVKKKVQFFFFSWYYFLVTTTRTVVFLLYHSVIKYVLFETQDRYTYFYRVVFRCFLEEFANGTARGQSRHRIPLNSFSKPIRGKKEHFIETASFFAAVHSSLWFLTSLKNYRKRVLVAGWIVLRGEDCCLSNVICTSRLIKR